MQLKKLSFSSGLPYFKKRKKIRSPLLNIKIVNPNYKSVNPDYS